MKQIEKTLLRLERNQYGYITLIVSVVFFFAGCFVLIVGLGLIPNPFAIENENWIIKAAGLYLSICGLILFSNSGAALFNDRRKRHFGRRLWKKCYRDYLWDPRGIDDESSEHWKNVLLGIILFSLIVFPLNWLSFFREKSSVVLQAVTLLFDFGMIILLGSLVYFILHTLKYGKSKILFNSFPFFIGGKIDISFLNKGFSKIHCCLRYIEERYERRDSEGDFKRVLVCYELYNEKRVIQTTPQNNRVAITFDLPDNSNWVNNLLGTESIRYWEIELESQQKGVDYCTSFLLPVYHRST